MTTAPRRAELEPTSVLDQIEIELAQETYEDALAEGAPERAARAFEVVEALRSAEQAANDEQRRQGGIS